MWVMAESYIWARVRSDVVLSWLGLGLMWSSVGMWARAKSYVG